MRTARSCATQNFCLWMMLGLTGPVRAAFRSTLHQHHHRAAESRSRLVRAFLPHPATRRSIARTMTSSTTTTATTTTIDADMLGKVQIPVDTAIAHHDHCIFLDGTWWLDKNRPTNHVQDFERGPRIAGAHLFDIDDVCAHGPVENPHALPHMMPSPSTFGRAMDAFGVTASNNNNNHIVVYGHEGCGFVHRAWFQIYCMGHDINRVHLLEGSLQDWIDAGGPVDDEPVQAVRIMDDSAEGSYSYPARAARNVVDKAEVRRLVDRASNIDDDDDNKNNDTTVLVDVRSSERYHGTVAEKRPGLQRGHMPTAVNLCSANLLDPAKPNILKPRDELRTMIAEALGPSVLEPSSDVRVVASCGSGVTACTMAAALIECGVDPSRVNIYDGSWMEWGRDPENPVVQDN